MEEVISQCSQPQMGLAWSFFTLCRACLGQEASFQLVFTPKVHRLTVLHQNCWEGIHEAPEITWTKSQRASCLCSSYCRTRVVSKNSWVKRNTKISHLKNWVSAEQRCFALPWTDHMQGCVVVVSVGIFPALPSQCTDFILAAERCSLDWHLFLYAYIYKTYMLSLPYSLSHLDSLLSDHPVKILPLKPWFIAYF